MSSRSGVDLKMDITKEELLPVISMLKAELQYKETALAALKCEQIKRLLNPIEINRSSLASTYTKLQDRLKERDVNNNDLKRSTVQKTNTDDSQSTNQYAPAIDRTNDENLIILNTLLELLDKHPLLALPRDAVYCLDYDCNELSTKNYLNLKIQHLDNLINQHRGFRYYMNERLRQSEQRFIDATRKYELDKKLNRDADQLEFRNNAKAVLSKHIEQLKDALEREKRDKQAIVLTLLNELLDEREKVSLLTKDLTTRKNNESRNEIALQQQEEQRKAMHKLEAELQGSLKQLSEQAKTFHQERAVMQAQILNLEKTNALLESRLAQSEKLSAGSNSGETTIPTTTSKITTSRVVNKSPVGSQVNLSKGSPPGNSANRMSKPSKANPVLNSSTIQTTSKGANGSLNQSSPPSKTAVGSGSSSVGAKSTSGTRTTTSTARILSNSSSSAEQVPVRIQPLFKSASVASTNQQVRNPKTPPGATVNTTKTTSTNQGVTKPQVPAKPAQLLDHRTSFNQ